MSDTKIDVITQSLVDRFAASEALSALKPADQFERSATFSVVGSEHSETFD